jgi:hypothetical protein
MKANLLSYLAISLAGCSSVCAQVLEAWVASYPTNDLGTGEAYALAVDGTGNVYITGSATVKYDSNGQVLWNADGGVALAVDTAGNVFVAGTELTTDGGSQFVTTKYDTNGIMVWRSRYRGPEKLSDYVKAINVDSNGNVYVTGTSDCNNPPCDEGITQSDFATIKYDSNGTQLWVARYDGPGHATEQANGMAMDSSGNVYVTGLSYSAEGGIDYATVKYDSNGNQLWAARYNSGYDSPFAIAVDNAGNVCVTGESSRGDPKNYDYATVKYDANGNQLWAERYDGYFSGDDHAVALALDQAGNVYVTGYSEGFYFGPFGIFYDYVTIKYDPDGHRLWTARYDSPNGDPDVPSAIAVDKAGNVYVTGLSYDKFSDHGYGTVKYDGGGNELWRAFELIGGHVDSTDLALNGVGTLYVTGFWSASDEFGPHGNAVTVEYIQNGEEGLPAITSPPRDQTALPGEMVTLSVSATGNPPLYYQWMFDGDSILQATNASLVLTNARPDQWGNYSVVVTNDLGYTRSPEAVCRLMSVLTSPTLLPSGKFTFTVIGEAFRYSSIETSSDFVNWTVLTNFDTRTGTNQFTNSISLDTSQRFYRVVTP